MPTSLLILTVLSYLFAFVAIPVLIYCADKVHKEGQSNAPILFSIIIIFAYLIASTVYLIQGVFISNQLSELYRLVHIGFSIGAMLSGLQTVRLSQLVAQKAPDHQSIAGLIRDIAQHKKGA